MPTVHYWICNSCNKYRVKSFMNLGLMECAKCGVSPLTTGTATHPAPLPDPGQTLWDADRTYRATVNHNMQGGGNQYHYRVEHNEVTGNIDCRYKTGSWKCLSLLPANADGAKGQNVTQDSFLTPEGGEDLCILNIHDLEHYTGSEVKKNRRDFEKIHGKKVKLKFGFQAGNSNSGFGLIHILCRHQKDIWSKEELSDAANSISKIKKIIYDVTDIRTTHAGCDQIFYKNESNRYGFYGMHNTQRYLLVVEVSGTFMSVITLFKCQNINTGISSALAGGVEIYKHKKATGVVLNTKREDIRFASTRDDLKPRY